MIQTDTNPICFICVSLYHLRVGEVSVYIIYVWNSVSLHCLRLNWCQFVSSTFGLVGFYIIYCFYWCQSISSTFGLVSVYIVYAYIGVSLYRLHLDWCQFVSSMFLLVYVYIIYIWIGVSLYCLRVHWCQFVIN
jgi:hypothetical protein